MRRRFLMVGVYVATLFLLLFVLRVTRLAFPDWIALPMLFVVLVPYFVLFERVRVIEGRGFRCRQCGYDLQGQVDPRCPECGLEFNEAETARMRRASGAGDDERKPYRRSYVGRIAVAALIGALTVTLLLGIFYTRRARPASAPQTRAVLVALRAYADDNAGQMPLHAIQLAADDYLISSDFLTVDSSTAAESVPLADITIAQFDGQSPERKQAIAQAAIGALRDGTIAYRLGDFVFTYHGIDSANADPDLWVVIRSRDPSQNPPPLAQDSVAIGLCGGKVIRVRLAEFSQALSEQNALRAKHGLGPLPDPFAVTHAKPAGAKP